MHFINCFCHKHSAKSPLNIYLQFPSANLHLEPCIFLWRKALALFSTIEGGEHFLCVKQRVLNDLQRTRLTPRRMIWFPLPPLPSANCLFSQSSCVTRFELTDGREWGRSQIIRQRKAWCSINHSLLSGVKRQRNLKFNCKYGIKSKTFPIGTDSMKLNQFLKSVTGEKQLKDKKKR